MGLPWHRRYRRTLLSQAVWVVQAGQLLSSGRGLVDLSGNGNHAYFGGNASTPTTNDPTVLPWRGQKEVWFPGTSGNYISTPDSTSLRLSTDLDIRVLASLADWTPSSETALLGKWSISNNRGYRLGVTTSGNLFLDLSSDGSDTNRQSRPVTFTDGSTHWVRATWRASDGRVQFFESDDGVNWQQIGSDGTIAISGIYASTTSLLLGEAGGVSPLRMNGRLGRVQIFDSGTLVADFNANSLSEPYASLTDPQGNVWTLNRSSSGLKLAVVDRDMLALGTDDFLQVADHPLLNFGVGQDFTVWWVGRQYNTPSNSVKIAKKLSPSGTDTGYALRAAVNASESFFECDGPGSIVGVTLTNTPLSGRVTLLAGIKDVSQLVLSNVASASTAARLDSALSNGLPLYIGRFPSGAFGDFELIASGIHREALSADDLRRLAQELGVSP